MGYSERLVVYIDAVTGGAIRGFQQVGAASAVYGEKADVAQTRSQRLANAMPLIATGAVAVGAALYKSLDAYSEQERAQLKLENSLKRNPALAGESAKAFLDQASAIQKVTVASDESVVEAQAMLATFRLTKSQILELTPLVVDYARKFDTDLSTAAKQVGKAMDGQIGALKRNGVTIDENAFKTDRFAAVTEALRTQVGGFAKDEANTAAGSIQQFKNQLNEVAESIGKRVAPAVQIVSGLLTEITADSTATRVALTAVGAALGFAFGGPVGAAIGATATNLDLLAGATTKTLEPTDAVKAAAKKAGVSVEEYVRALYDATGGNLAAADAETRHKTELELATQAQWKKVEAVWAAIDADRAAENAVLSVQRAQEQYNAVMADPKSSSLDKAEAEGRYVDAINATVRAKGAAAAAELVNATEGEKNRASIDAQKQAYEYLMGTVSGPVKAAVAGYYLQLLATQGPFTAKVYAETFGAEMAIQALIAKYSGVNIGLGVVTAEGIARVHGGPRNLDGSPRQFGGGVTSGHPYIVGEAGPELMIPGASGAIIPNNRLGGLGGGTTVMIKVDAPVGTDYPAAGREIAAALDAHFQRRGGSWRNN